LPEEPRHELPFPVSWKSHGFVTGFFRKTVTDIGHMALGKRNTACLHSLMEVSDAGYRSFIIRIWGRDRVQKGDPISEPRKGRATDQAVHDTGDDAPAGDWLMQVEDIASGKKRYFSDIHALSGYVDKSLGVGHKSDQGS